MLGPEHFLLIVAVLLGLLLGWASLLGVANRRRSGTAGRVRARRDVIAEGVITPRQLDDMHASENARLRAQGHPPLTRGELEARVVGDARARWRLLRVRRRG